MLTRGRAPARGRQDGFGHRQKGGERFYKHRKTLLRTPDAPAAAKSTTLMSIGIPKVSLAAARFFGLKTSVSTPYGDDRDREVAQEFAMPGFLCEPAAGSHQVKVCREHKSRPAFLRCQVSTKGQYHYWSQVRGRTRSPR